MDSQFNEPIGALIPRKRLAQDLGVCSRTVVNLAKRDPLFPQPLKISRRTYYTQAAVENYKRSLLRQAMTARA
jgi:predicted DNA-binding transcriptional regulator AlpA